MPIGKNSIKRVANAGYSRVKTEAPDMENSEIKAEAKTEETDAVREKTAVKKTPAKKSAPKAQKKAKPTLVTAEKFAVGDPLPIYLL